MQFIRCNPWLRGLAISFLMFSLVLTSGCGGCRNTDSAAEKAKKEKEEEEKKKKKKRSPTFKLVLQSFCPAFIHPKKTKRMRMKMMTNLIR